MQGHADMDSNVGFAQVSGQPTQSAGSQAPTDAHNLNLLAE
jgi:hypothetical protein